MRLSLLKVKSILVWFEKEKIFHLGPNQFQIPSTKKLLEKLSNKLPILLSINLNFWKKNFWYVVLFRAELICIKSSLTGWAARKDNV